MTVSSRRRKPRLATIFWVSLALMTLVVIFTRAPWPVRVAAAMILLPLVAVLLTVQALRASDPADPDAEEVLDTGEGSDVAVPGAGRPASAADDVEP